jgi:hypothetical protein
VPKTTNGELEGITLQVYLYVVERGKPVGPRDVMKGAHLSSPSVAYRHLERLEDLGLLQRNEFGEYAAAKKANISGYSWVGRHLVSKMVIYAVIFMGIFILELWVFIIHYSVENYKFQIFFLLLMLVTGFAMVLFAIEGLRNNMKNKLSTQTEHEQVQP